VTDAVRFSSPALLQQSLRRERRRRRTEREQPTKKWWTSFSDGPHMTRQAQQEKPKTSLLTSLSVPLLTAWTASVGLVLAAAIRSPSLCARSSPSCHRQPRARDRVDRLRQPRARRCHMLDALERSQLALVPSSAARAPPRGPPPSASCSPPRAHAAFRPRGSRLLPHAFVAWAHPTPDHALAVPWIHAALPSSACEPPPPPPRLPGLVLVIAVHSPVASPPRRVHRPHSRSRHCQSRARKPPPATSLRPCMPLSALA